MIVQLIYVKNTRSVMHKLVVMLKSSILTRHYLHQLRAIINFVSKAANLFQHNRKSFNVNIVYLQVLGRKISVDINVTFIQIIRRISCKKTMLNMIKKLIIISKNNTIVTKVYHRVS